MRQKVFIFEDAGYSNFFPLTYSRPTYKLLFGINTLEQKISLFFPEVEITLLCRDFLKNWIASKSQHKVNSFGVEDDDQILLINGRVVFDKNLRSDLPFSNEDKIYLCAKEVVAISLRGSSFEKYKEKIRQLCQPQNLDYIKQQLKNVRIKAEMVNYLWDLVERNGEQIKKDFELVKKSLNIKTKRKANHIDSQVVLYNDKEIFIGEQAQINAFVVLDARKGPIYADRKVTILSHTRIEGPCYIGEGSSILGGMIREGNSFGPVSRIAGEVEKSIILGYSNKYHHGFLGHSYVGEWVNLGALTTNSDLKNNYSSIRVMLNGEMVNTGLSKVGVFMADHVKTGIGTLLNSGTIVGFSTNIFGGGMPKEKFIPSFYWGGKDGWEKYQLEKAIQTAEIIIARRQIKTGENLRELFHKIFELTQKEIRA
jgi:UDP-N-acetylglucosamine diphosphorylase/glucosamine-1-phosphate N-acetyltransferase